MIPRLRIAPPCIGVLFLFSTLLMLPAVLFGTGGHDMLMNCMKVRMFAQQFWHGDLYPRWLQDQFAGNGSPVFFYYPPLAYFITSFFIFLAPLDPFGYYPVAASVWLAILLAGITFAAWMQDEGRDARAALIGSLLYMGAPAMIGWNFYYLMLFPSVWGWAFLPLLMLFAKRTVDRRPYATEAFALALAALILTNIPMTIIFGPMAVAYAACFVQKHTCLRQGIRLATAILLGFGLSALFLIPAASYLDYSLAKTFWSADPQDCHHYLVILGFGNFNQTLWTCVILAMALLTLLYGHTIRTAPRHYIFFCIASLLSLFMLIPASAFVWEAIPALTMLQYPERFFMASSLCLAVLASVAAPRLRWLDYGLMALYIACTFLLSHLDARVTEDGLRKNSHWRYEQYTLNLDFPGLLTSFDLFPRYTDTDSYAALDRPHEKVKTMHGDAVADIIRWRPRDIAFHYKALKPSVLRIGQFYFAGTIAFTGDSMYEVGRDASTGQTLIAVPPGEEDVHVELAQLLPEVAGRIISLICAGIVALGFLVEFRKRRSGNASAGETLLDHS